MIEKTIQVFLLVNFVISTYLSIRNLIALYKPKTDFSKRVCSDTEYSQMQNYNRDKILFRLFDSLCKNLKDLFVLRLRLYQKVYQDFFINMYMSEILFFLSTLNLNVIYDIPFELVGTFLIEQKHGFNNMTFGLYVKDFIKKNAILNIIIFLVMSMMLKIISSYLNSFWLYLWICMSLFQLSAVIIFPVYIQPLFNKFRLLEDGSLKDKINELCAKVNFKASKVFVMDGSTRSSHSNAYFTGIFGEKRIVLYDTLLKQLSEEEIIAVLCHEFGHWYQCHTIKLVCVVLTQQLFYFWMTNQILNNDIFTKTLFYQGEPLIIKLLYVSYLLNITEFPMTLLCNVLSRRYENQADNFAITNGYGTQLVSGLIKLGKENKGNLSQDSLYSTFYNSHPTSEERVNMIEKELSKRE